MDRTEGLFKSKVLLNLVLLALLGYGAITLLVYLFQARLLYFPEIARDITTTPRATELPFEDVWLDHASGARVHGWYVPRPQAKGVALLMHGNAGSIGGRLDWLRMFYDLGYASLIVDYRGYGRSGGSPSEAGTYEDARAAWDHLVLARGWRAQDIVVVGESLGGPIAAHLAAAVTPRALFLHSTFTSVPDLAAQIYWFLPVRWISRFRYDTRASLDAVTVPILIAHSPDDEIVPYTHGRALYDHAKPPKRFVELQGGHNAAFVFARREWTDALARFLDDVALSVETPDSAGP